MASIALLLLGFAFTWYLGRREAYERKHVEVAPELRKVAADPSGYRATVVRRIHLAAWDGRTIGEPEASDPAPPFRLDAPDEKTLELELTRGQESELGFIALELIDDKEPVRWPVLLEGHATARASGSATLTITPPTPSPSSPPASTPPPPAAALVAKDATPSATPAPKSSP